MQTLLPYPSTIYMPSRGEYLEASSWTVECRVEDKNRSYRQAKVAMSTRKVEIGMWEIAPLPGRSG